MLGSESHRWDLLLPQNRQVYGVTQSSKTPFSGKAIELFAGVGGFRLGLQRSGWDTIWSNQWEPSTRAQHASDCYVTHFGPDGHSNEDINAIPLKSIPKHDLLVGGFPCQDYSVAKALSQAQGINGKKGVLWWRIHEILEHHRPEYLLLENVDRLLKSPSGQRGRDFAIILKCLSDLGYLVEWRVVNAAEYGYAQRRKRVFIAGRRLTKAERQPHPLELLYETGTMARALPIKARPTGRNVLELPGVSGEAPDLLLRNDLVYLSERFGLDRRTTPFRSAGVMVDGEVWTRDVEAKAPRSRRVLGDILVAESEVPEQFFVPDAQLSRWAYLKGAKNEERVKKTGFTYRYSEGAIAYPDPIDRASRTILTGEGGTSPSRFKHIIETPSGRLRRLVPVELERLNRFPDEWTATGMSDGRRAFMMGNALVIDLVTRISRELEVA